MSRSYILILSRIYASKPKSHWFQVSIQVLNLSENRIPVPDEFPVDSLKSLRHLVLGDMAYSWQDVEQVAGDLPNLEVLQVHNNGFVGIEVTPGKFSALKELDLDENEFTSWAAFDSLHKIQNLQRLHLNHNKLKTIVIDHKFENLKFLQLSHNQFEEWKHIGELDTLNLQELRLRHNPLLQREKESTARSMIIALINSLTALNGTEITKEEKNWAELDYYKKYGLEYLKVLKLEEPDKNETLKKFSDDHR